MNLLKRLNHLVSETYELYSDIAAGFNLSDSAFMVLYTVCNNGGKCLISEIKMESGLSKQTINSALRKLETEDVLYLELSGGKNKMVCLTEKGRTLTENTVAKVIKMENDILNSWSEHDRMLYLELTQKYLIDLKERKDSL